MKTTPTTTQVVLNLGLKHYEMIQRCAKLNEQSVEKWIGQATESSLWGDLDEFGHIGLELGFDNAEIREAIAEARA